MTLVSVWLTASALARCLAPSSFSLLSLTLRRKEVTQVLAGGDSPDTVWAKETHLSDTNVRFCLRDFASSMMPDMSLPSLVRLLLLILQ